TFRLLVADAAGGESVEHADVVIDCTGTYGNPNSVGDGGIPAPGERALGDRIERRLPHFEREARDWASGTTLLTGAGHSAQTAARALAGLAREAPGMRVIWAIRSSEPSWGAVAGDPLPERARLTASAAELVAGGSEAVEPRLGFVTEELAPREGGIAVTSRNDEDGAGVVDRGVAVSG